MARDPKTDSAQLERRWLGLTRSEWLLGITVILLAGLLVHPYRAQQASRYALTAAVVEQGTLVLDDYAHVLGRDRAVRDDHIYSDKAPGQPFLAVPIFALGKAIGVEDATVLRIDGNLGLWWVTLWSAALPGAALAVIMYRRARGFVARGALLATAAVSAGTLLLPFSALLFGHVLAAALLYGCFLLLAGEGGGWRLSTAGAIAGLAVAVEYTAVLGVVVLAVYTFWRHRWSGLAWVAGGVPIAIALGIYNAFAFGDPLTLSYQFTAFNEITESSRRVLAIFSSGSMGNLWRLLIEGRGLLLGTPIVVVALAGAIHRLRRGFQIDAVVGISMFLAFIWIPIFWGNPWGGASPGPRYLVPSLPFLAVPVVWAWQRWPRLTMVASTLSITTMFMATITDPILNRDSVNGLNTWIRWLLDGKATDTVLTMGMGAFGWVVHAGLVAAVGTLLVKSHRAGGAGGKSI